MLVPPRRLSARDQPYVGPFVERCWSSTAASSTVLGAAVFLVAWTREIPHGRAFSCCRRPRPTVLSRAKPPFV
jgi:hypothetical protein